MPSPERQLLLAPDLVARAAARVAAEPEQRWMLGQPRGVRRSFVDEVLERPDAELRQQVWMLRQDDEVRRSYVREVLAEQDPPPREEIWMLAQDDGVRESYVREVLLGDAAWPRR